MKKPRETSGAGGGETDKTTLAQGNNSLVPFFPAQLDDAGYSVYEIRVYLRLCRRANGLNGVARESVGNMAAGCRMSPRKVHQALMVLEVAGLITASRSVGKVTEYRLTFAYGAKVQASGLHEVQSGLHEVQTEGTSTKVPSYTHTSETLIREKLGSFGDTLLEENTKRFAWFDIPLETASALVARASESNRFKVTLKKLLDEHANVAGYESKNVPGGENQAQPRSGADLLDASAPLDGRRVVN